VSGYRRRAGAATAPPCGASSRGGSHTAAHAAVPAGEQQPVIVLVPAVHPRGEVGREQQQQPRIVIRLQQKSHDEHAES
jgi:hypothetical protein